MKKKIIIAGGILLFSCVLAFLCSQPKLVTGKKSELQKVVIVEDPNYRGKNLKTVITEEKTMYDMYMALKNMPVRANRYPDHVGSLQFDAGYMVIFYYLDKQDEIIVHSKWAYRFLETRGGSGDPGFTKGNAKRLLHIIESITGNE